MLMTLFLTKILLKELFYLLWCLGYNNICYILDCKFFIKEVFPIELGVYNLIGMIWYSTEENAILMHRSKC